MDKKIAFVFSGQGSQYKGMGLELYETNKNAKKIFDKLENIRPGLKKLCFETDQKELSQTINAQPCLFAVNLAAAYALEEYGIKAQACAGYSLGEISAIAYSKMLSLEDAFRLVIKRAQAMQKCAENSLGGMAAVLGLDEKKVQELCRLTGIYPVNFNCPGQITVAGDLEKIDRFLPLAQAQGGKVVKLAVNGAFHSPKMSQAALEIKEYLKSITLNDPEIDIYSNVTGQKYAKPYDELLAGQIDSPVRWQTIIQNMIKDGFRVFVEAGAGKTLSGFIKKIDNTVEVYSVQDQNSLKAAADVLS